MIEMHLQCITCNSVYDIVDKYQCDSCAGIPEVEHNYDKIKDTITDEFQSPPSYNIWKYKYLLPVIDSKCMVTLYEGGTPLIKSNNLSRKTGFKNLYLRMNHETHPELLKTGPWRSVYQRQRSSAGILWPQLHPETLQTAHPLSGPLNREKAEWKPGLFPILLPHQLQIP